MVIDFSTLNIKERPMLVLRNLDGTPIQVLGYAYNVEAEIFYNEMSSLKFDLPELVDGVKTPGYDDVIGTRIVDLIGYGQFILIDPKVDKDGVCEIKSCKAYSLEYELTYKKLSLEEGTYNFWNPFSREGTIIDIILSYLPSWSVGEIDDILIGRYRTFDVSYENIYNFIKSTLQQKYGCIFDFDTYHRKINVRAVSSDTEVAPVYISLENLVQNITIEEDTENIFTVLDVNGAEGVTIRSVNPLGTNKIYNLDYYMNTSHFSQNMIDSWNSWKESFDANQLVYYNLTTEQALKTAAILTEEHKLAEMKDAELAALEAEQAVYIEYLASISKNSSDYSKYSDLLKTTADKISAKKSSITSQEAIVSALKAEKDSLTRKLVNINKAVAFDNFFTADELTLLDRYFKEDAIEDSAFVYEETETYVADDLSSQISDVLFRFESGEVTTNTTEDGREIFMIRGGSIVSGAVSAAVIRASAEFRDDGTMVMSGYLQAGSVGDTKFPSGCISLTGSFSGRSSDNKSSLIFTANSAYLYFTKNTTEYERRAVEWDLFEYGTDCLKKLAYPSYSFDVDAANFFVLDEYLQFASKIALGSKVYLRLDENAVLQPIFIGAKFGFDDIDSLTLHFGDTYSASKSSFELVDLLEQSVSMGKTVDTSRFSYNSFINSGASTAVRDYMNSALDASKQAILSGENMAISWDASGMKFRKWNSAKTDYEKEQIAVINNNIVFTDDGWQTAKMAIGKFVDANSGVSWGVVAPSIVGTLLAGENLVIDTENGAFKVDSSGVYIDALKFVIAHGDSSENLDNYLTSRENEVSKNFKDAIEEATKSLEDAIGDGYVTTYYSSEFPTDSREGDLWYVDSEEDIVYNDVTYEATKLYRYNGTSWEIIKDADITQAIKDAANAQATADKKIVSYYSAETPAAPGYGDIWYVTGENSDGYNKGKLYRYNGTKWELVEDNDIPVIKNEISSTKETLSSIINENGHLKADKMQGVINAQATQMKSAAGNVLFDDQGLWLMNSPNKSTMTKAVWMNENGILIGTGNVSDNPADEWNWTTAIGPDGIVASAIAAGTLSGMKIVGGELNIGNGNFVVTEAGNLTANTGTFKGTVQGASFKTASGVPMMADGYAFDAEYLNLRGIKITNGNTTTFAVNSDTGAVTINGATSISGNITMNGGSINWDKVADNGALEIANGAAEDAADALNKASNAAEDAADALEAAGTAEERATAADELAKALLAGHYGDELTEKTKISGMYIYSPNIYSPTIYGNAFNIIGNSGLADGKTVFTAYYDEELNMSVLGSRSASFGFVLSAETLGVSSNYVNFAGCNIVNFEGCDVQGLTSTAVFG